MSDERSTDIPPALTPQQWADRSTKREPVELPFDGMLARIRNGGLQVGRYPFGNLKGDTLIWVGKDVSDLAALIALANEAMNDEDPRKFTREHVVILRALADEMTSDVRHVPDPAKPDEYASVEKLAIVLGELADVLESYLPPRPDHVGGYSTVDG